MNGAFVVRRLKPPAKSWRPFGTKKRVSLTVTLQPNEVGQENHARNGEHVRSAGFSPYPRDKIRPEGRTTNAPLHSAEVLRLTLFGPGVEPGTGDKLIAGAQRKDAGGS